MTDRIDTAGDGASHDAADWFARLNSDTATAQDWIAFDAWLAADPTHAPAFSAIEAVWLDLDLDLDDAKTASAEIISFQRPPAKAMPVFGRPGRRVWAGLAAAGLAVVTLVVAGGVHFLGGVPEQTALDVPTGQTRTLALRGGAATLAGGTRLELAQTADGQNVRLQVGSATFRLKHDPSRRLTVLAGGQRITDIGTVFTTHLSDAALLVSVSEGEVEVRPVTAAGRPVRVHAGQALVRRSDEATSRVLADDLTVLHRPYQDASLAEVVADLNQFYSRPIKIDGTSIGRLRFTGVLVLDSEEAVVRRLEAYLPVTARISADAVVLAAR